MTDTQELAAALRRIQHTMPIRLTPTDTSARLLTVSTPAG